MRKWRFFSLLCFTTFLVKWLIFVDEMANQFIDKQLNKRFGEKKVFTRDDLWAFYRSYNSEITETAFAWQIYDLKRKHIIDQVKIGVYKLGKSQAFRPDLDREIIGIAKRLAGSFDHHFYNIWNTKWLNEFTELQAVAAMVILEVDRDSVERVFYNIKDHGYRNVYFKPDETVLEKYVSELSESLIIRPMIVRAPTITIKKVVLPTLEKILVDLFCDDKLFFAYQGNHLIKIYEAAIEKYSINFSKMFNYAKRRSREENLKKFLLDNLYNLIKDLIE
jgi:hypothetical protein